MANIGSFKKSGNDYTGEIVTMSLQKKSVRIVAEEASENEKAPSHRVFVGRAEIGAAWHKTSKEDREYLSIKLDDPSFAAPIFATLFADEDGKTPQPDLDPRAHVEWRLIPTTHAPPGSVGRGFVLFANRAIGQRTLAAIIGGLPMR